MTTDFEPPSLRTTLIATGIALVVASVVLVGAVLPAEYGIDPTGVGGLLGLTRLDEEPATEEPAQENRTPTASLSEYVGSWPTRSTTLLSEEGELAEGQERVFTVDVTEPDLVRFDVRVTWTDDDGAGGQPTAPDIFELHVQPPRGPASVPVAARNAEDGAGLLESSRVLRDAPEPATVTATDGEAAYFALRDLHAPDHEGVGSWNVTVALVEVGQRQVQGVDVPGTDAGNAFHVEVAATQFFLDTNVTATVRVDDFVFTLEPGEGMEHKVFAAESMALEYAWNATGDVYYDFHGDPAGGDGSDFVRHDEGTSRAESGTLAVPFDGDHGWYWQNTGGGPVEVRLRLRGDYFLLH